MPHFERRKQNHGTGGGQSKAAWERRALGWLLPLTRVGFGWGGLKSPTCPSRFFETVGKRGRIVYNYQRGSAGCRLERSAPGGRYGPAASWRDRNRSSKLCTLPIVSVLWRPRYAGMVIPSRRSSWGVGGCWPKAGANSHRGPGTATVKLFSTCQCVLPPSSTATQDRRND